MSTLKVNKIENTGTTDGGIEIDNTGHVQIDGVQMPTAGALSNRNLIINGAMNVAQRGSSGVTTSGFGTVDRFQSRFSSGSVTQSQETLTSGTPFNEGFRFFYRQTNTSAASDTAAGERKIQYFTEAQDITCSGWDCTSSSSFITLSFFVRSSVGQEFFGYLRSNDGTNQSYAFSTGTLTAGTWEKVTKTIPGNSNITINTDTGAGLELVLAAFFGTDFTDSSKSVDSWSAHSNSARSPDNTSTWATTAGATFDITGVQLEVGEKATPFEHRSYGDELHRCQRYYFQIDPPDGNANPICTGLAVTSHTCSASINFPIAMREAPTSLTSTGTASDYNLRSASGSGAATGAPSLAEATKYTASFGIIRQNELSAGDAVLVRFNTAASFLGFSAELS